MGRPAARLDALLGHYERFAALFSADCQRSIFAGQSLELARLEGRRNARLRIVFAASTTAQTQREGELTLSLLRDGGPATLSRLTFTLADVEGRLAVAIGALSVHAVSDARHVHRRLPDDPKFVSYDAYWRERGAVEGGLYGFVFPPLRPAEAPKTGRDWVKSAVVAGVEAFLAAHRADRQDKDFTYNMR